MTRLVAGGRVREAIVVGIWSTPRRFDEYMPAKPVSASQVTMLDGVPPVPRAQDALMRASGYGEGDHWMSRVFEGAEHSERAWRERVEVPLKFLLGE